MPTHLTLSLGDAAPTSVTISDAIIAGWTGRDAEAVEKHIRELEALGVKRPSATPIYYRVAASRITTESTIQVSGTASSGEVEFVLLQARGKLWVGVGSDHTDREVEAYDVTVSKQMCEKPIAPRFWDMAEVQPHWDRLTLKSYIEENGARTLYQEGCVTAMRDPADLIARYTGGRPLAEGSVMFCGTFAVKGGVRPSSTFDFELADPVLERSIAHHYVSQSLPKVS